MQGINPLTMKCTYETPCGWCAKWDKKCDRKIGPSPIVVLPCKNCVSFGQDEVFMPHCKECNTDNNFKYFERKKD